MKVAITKMKLSTRNVTYYQRVKVEILHLPVIENRVEQEDIRQSPGPSLTREFVSGIV